MLNLFLLNYSVSIFLFNMNVMVYFIMTNNLITLDWGTMMSKTKGDCNHGPMTTLIGDLS